MIRKQCLQPDGQPDWDKRHIGLCKDSTEHYAALVSGQQNLLATAMHLVLADRRVNVVAV